MRQKCNPPPGGRQPRRARSDGLRAGPRRLSAGNDLPGDAALLHTLPAIGTRRGEDASQVALAFVLEHPFVEVVLSGAATVAQLDAHVQALTIRLDDEARAALAPFVEPPARYWAGRAALPWR